MAQQHHDRSGPRADAADGLQVLAGHRRRHPCRTFERVSSTGGRDDRLGPTALDIEPMKLVIGERCHHLRSGGQAQCFGCRPRRASSPAAQDALPRVASVQSGNFLSAYRRHQVFPDRARRRESPRRASVGPMPQRCCRGESVPKAGPAHPAAPARRRQPLLAPGPHAATSAALAERTMRSVAGPASVSVARQMTDPSYRTGPKVPLPPTRPSARPESNEKPNSNRSMASGEETWRRSCLAVGSHETAQATLGSATTGFVSVPMPSMVIETSSPGFSSRGGSKYRPTPAGVPVAMIVPGSSVNAVDKCSTIS